MALTTNKTKKQNQGEKKPQTPCILAISKNNNYNDLNAVYMYKSITL